MATLLFTAKDRMRRDDLESQTLLAIDCGTQSLRGILFARDGSLLTRAQVEYTPCFSSQPGWAEQDPELYWNSLISVCGELKKINPAGFKAVAGVGVTTQRASMVNVDLNGIPLRPAILWMDQRKAGPVWGQTGLLSAGFHLLGLKKKLADNQSSGKCNWIRQHQPGIWEKTHKYLQISGFLNHRLTGQFSDSTASQIGHIPFDYKKQIWARRFTLTRKLFPVEPDKLPDLVAPGERIGTVTPAAAGQTGLEPGLPVIACGSDKGCETLGTGCISPRVVSLSFGTTATVQTVSDTYVEPFRYLPPYPSVVPGFYNPEIEIFRGFWMISWFKKQFAHKEAQEAGKTGRPVEEVLNRCLERTDPGAMGLVVQPYWGPGLDHPDAKGAMIGFGDVHTKDHVYRAMIEGLGFALYEGILTLEKKTGQKMKRAAVSGGASQSDAICKITADICNLPMVKTDTHETSALGAAILVAAGLGWYPDLDSAARRMVRVKTVFEPDKKNAAVYRQLYSRVYAKMYGALKPLYSQIKDITGYPKS